MSNQFIPSFHYENPQKKLTPDWCKRASDYCLSTPHSHLLSKKNRKKIDSFATGNYSMDGFKRIFASIRKAMDSAEGSEGNRAAMVEKADETGIDWQPLPLIPTKLNSAISTISKIPVEVTCTAADELAAKKKKEDIRFLQNKGKVEQQLSGIANKLGFQDADLGTTKYSAVPLGDSPYGLNLNKQDQLFVFENVLYSLAVEAGYETMLQAWWKLKNAEQVERLQIKDQFYYGVSVQRTFRNSMTRLPDLQWVDPATMKTPDSKLPDYSDNPFRLIEEEVEAIDIYNHFSGELSKQDVQQIIFAKGTGYCSCNRVSTPKYDEWGSFKMKLQFFEIKSVDWVGVKKVNKKSSFETFTTDEKEADYKLWAQNTYSFVRIMGTDHIFSIERLDDMYRAEGYESFTNFSTDIYKSQEKSCVEQAISEQIKAQIADIKMQHAIISSKPSGEYVDLRFMRNAVQGLNSSDDDDDDSGEHKYTIEHLLKMGFERNKWVGDSEGMDKPSDAQLRPVIELQGGVKTEVEGYIRVIADANAKISAFTGINEQMTGQQANPEGLVGMQKLLINSSLNSIYYCNQAISHQCERMFARWAFAFKQAIEEGGEAKKAVIRLIGSQKVQVIDQMDDAYKHSIGVFCNIGQREVERQRFENDLALLKQKGIIGVTDEYMISYVTNPKDKLALLAVKEQMAIERQQEQQQAMMAHQQELKKMEGQNQVQAIQTQGQVDANLETVKGQVQERIKSLASQLGLNEQQFVWAAKDALQTKRMQGQSDGKVKTIYEKANAEAQASLT